MHTVFADTGFWIALLNPRDSLHSKARVLDASSRIGHVVTSEMVLGEFLNDTGARGRKVRTAASRFVAALQGDPDVTIIPQTSDLFWRSAQLFAKRADKDWSLTDCASYLVMRERRIDQALTHDRHFEQLGFRALLRGA